MEGRRSREREEGQKEECLREEGETEGREGGGVSREGGRVCVADDGWRMREWRMTRRELCCSCNHAPKSRPGLGTSLVLAALSSLAVMMAT